MINKLTGFLIMASFLTACKQEQKTLPKDSVKANLTELSDVYSYPVKKDMYSKNVSDSFTIFTSLPKGFTQNKKYPLIILLDANAFFESVVDELKFNSFTGMVPESIIIGIGYKNFPAMDSLRNRDYTYPVAIPEYEMVPSGGADKFKNFIDKELLPELNNEYKNIDSAKTVLCGHSLGGYFTLFYFLKSAEEKDFHIRNFVSASPSLFYNHRYLFDMEKKIRNDAISLPSKVYISMGSEDMNGKESKGILTAFEKQLSAKKYPGLQLSAREYTNFGHIDAALPGFIKGITYVLQPEMSKQ
ncbi:alpha/beta hydrolase [Chitinophagaceae bacterium LWZ2-11]